MKVAIFGAAGYGGIELIRLLRRHPEAELVYLADPACARLSEVYPHLGGPLDLEMQPPDVERAIEVAEVVFFCLQPGLATEMVATAVAAGRQVLDFSADFRLKSREVYERLHGEHKAPDLIGRAPYGLPELHRDEIHGAEFVAVPGCHPTAAVLALAPAVQGGLVDVDTICIDSKTGISGVGRSHVNILNHYPEAGETLMPYGMPAHRHRPEIEQELGFLAGRGVQVTFAPSRVPMVRGILSTAFASLTAEPGDVRRAYEGYYGEEPFVRLMAEGSLPQTKQVSGTNYCDVGLSVDERMGRLVAFAAVDNIVKGLSGAAVQCWNLMCGYDETTGLTEAAVWP